MKPCLNIQTPSQNISNLSSSQTLLISVVHNDFNFLFISKCLYSFEKKRQQQQNLPSAPILNEIFTERHHFRCLLYREEILLIPAKKFITPIKFFRFTIRKNYITLEISGVGGNVFLSQSSRLCIWLKRPSTILQRRVKEAIHIRLHPNNINRDNGIEIP